MNRSQFIFSYTRSPYEFLARGEQLYFSKPFPLDDYTEAKLRNRPSWYEVNTSSSVPLIDQVNVNNMNLFVNQNVINEGQMLFDELEGKMDMGGITEKDRLIYTANPQGIFDFASASRGLIRPTEFYCEELKELINPLYVNSIKLPNNRTEFWFERNGKRYTLRRQQEGVQSILDANSGAVLREVFPDFWVCDPIKFGENSLKFRTTTKKAYLTRNKKGGYAKFVDLFVICGGLGDMNSEGMYAKNLAIIQLARILDRARVKTRIYALRAYTADSRYVLHSFVVKEYGETIDVNKIAVFTSDPRFFRFSLWRATEGNNYGLGYDVRGHGSTIYAGSTLDEVFVFYRNYLFTLKERGLMDSKVEHKYLMMVASGEGNANVLRNQTREIEDTFFAISDVVEIVSAKDLRKAVQRIRKRELMRNKTLTQVKKYLIQKITQAFRTIPKIAPDDLYGNTDIEIRDFEDRKDRVIDELNNILR